MCGIKRCSGICTYLRVCMPTIYYIVISYLSIIYFEAHAYYMPVCWNKIIADNEINENN